MTGDSLDVLTDTIDARWSSLKTMDAAAWDKVARRVSVCLYCLGPALLSDEELELVITEPLCRRCRAQVVAA